MKLSHSDKLALIREYRNQGGKGSYLSLLQSYPEGGTLPLKEPSMLEATTNNVVEDTFPYNGKSRYKGSYQIDKAKEIYTPDETGHLPSVDYRTGVWLKDKDYPTAWKELMSSQLNLELNKLVGSPILNEEGRLQYIKGYNSVEEVAPTMQHFDGGGNLPLSYPEGGSIVPINREADKLPLVAPEAANRGYEQWPSYPNIQRTQPINNTKKSIIFAETPKKNTYHIWGNEESMPKDLQVIVKAIQNIRSKEIELSNNKVRQNNVDLMGNLEAARDILTHKFYDSSSNPGIPDPTFITEGNKFKQWYSKQNKEASVVPIYGLGDTTKVNNALANSNLEDVSIMGHSGDKLGGIPLLWWNKKLKNTKYDKCILGTCYGDEVAKLLPDAQNIYSTTSEQQWHGVNPTATTLENAIFSTHEFKRIQPVQGVNYNVTRKRSNLKK